MLAAHPCARLAVLGTSFTLAKVPPEVKKRRAAIGPDGEGSDLWDVLNV